MLGWKTSEEKTRGIALALGTAQILDGIVHLTYPNVYSDDQTEAIASAGNIFLVAGMLGVLSVLQYPSAQ